MAALQQEVYGRSVLPTLPLPWLYARVRPARVSVGDDSMKRGGSGLSTLSGVALPPAGPEDA